MYKSGRIRVEEKEKGGDDREIEVVKWEYNQDTVVRKKQEQGTIRYGTNKIMSCAADRDSKSKQASNREWMIQL